MMKRSVHRSRKPQALSRVFCSRTVKTTRAFMKCAAVSRRLQETASAWREMALLGTMTERLFTSSSSLQWNIEISKIPGIISLLEITKQLVWDWQFVYGTYGIKITSIWLFFVTHKTSETQQTSHASWSLTELIYFSLALFTQDKFCWGTEVKLK